MLARVAVPPLRCGTQLILRRCTKATFRDRCTITLTHANFSLSPHTRPRVSPGSPQAEYPTSTRHFLLIGFLGMFVGSIVFCYLAMRKKANNVRPPPPTRPTTPTTPTTPPRSDAFPTRL